MAFLTVSISLGINVMKLLSSVTLILFAFSNHVSNLAGFFENITFLKSFIILIITVNSVFDFFLDISYLFLPLVGILLVYCLTMILFL